MCSCLLPIFLLCFPQFLTVLYICGTLVLNLRYMLQLSFPSFRGHLALFIVGYSTVSVKKCFVYWDLLIFPFIGSDIWSIVRKPFPTPWLKGNLPCFPLVLEWFHFLCLLYVLDPLVFTLVNGVKRDSNFLLFSKYCCSSTIIKKPIFARVIWDAIFILNWRYIFMVSISVIYSNPSLCLFTSQ